MTSEQMNLKSKMLVTFVQTICMKNITWKKKQNRKESPNMEIPPDNEQLKNHHVTMNKREAYISGELQLQNLFKPSIFKSKSLLSATSILSWQPKPAQKEVVVEERQTGKTRRFVWLLRYTVDSNDCAYAQLWVFAIIEDDKKFQQNV